MTLLKLYETAQGRSRPEDVAEMCRDILGGGLSGMERKTLEKAARGALNRGYGWGVTSMAQDFARPVGLQSQLPEAKRLFPNIEPFAEKDSDNPEVVADYLRRLNTSIGETFGAHDFKDDRLGHPDRMKGGLDVSRRRYNKMFRHIADMEERLATLRFEWRKYELTRIGKSGLATRLTPEEFERDTNSACFIAYYAARCNLRSEFTNGPQQRPFDNVAQMLLRRCETRGTTDWWAIAHVFPDSSILARLSDEQKGRLLGIWYQALSEIGEVLAEVWESMEVDTMTMIVRPGNDSTTWNNAASAWNKARQNWLLLIEALNMEEILQLLCPGKVPRLMAADVAYWHRASDSVIHGDTGVWSELPLPWLVLNGTKVCTLQHLETACIRHGIDPEKGGWIRARRRGPAVPFSPTPELVHGVTVANPMLAQFLRGAGVFSGKAKGAAAH